MKYNIGDRIDFGIESGVIGNYDYVTNKYLIKLDSGVIVSHDESYLNQYTFSNPKFKVGDKVKILYQTLKGIEGIIKGIDTNGTYEVEQTTGPNVGIFFYTMFENDLELIPQNQQVNQQTQSGWQTYVPTYTIPNGSNQTIHSFQFNKEGEVTKRTGYQLHSCTWKTYTGLMYKEDYCECGQTKNKRGIYE